MVTPIIAIDEDGAGDADKVDDPSPSRIALALKKASLEAVKSLFFTRTHKGNTEVALQLSAELAARGIPPSFRGMTRRDSLSLSAESGFILMAADLQWIVAAHPRHETDWMRAQAIYSPSKFMTTARYLYWDGQRAPGQLAKALALTVQQQHECAWIQCLAVDRWTSRLAKRIPIAREMITNAIRNTDKRDRAEQNETIERRVNLWHCAELAGWKPQRTANFYALMTGEKLPRNVVSNQLSKLPKVRRTDTVFPILGVS